MFVTFLDFGVESLPVVIPSSLHDFRLLLHAERAEFEAVLGIRVKIVDAASGPRMELLIDDAHDGAARLDWDAEQRVLTARASDGDGLARSLQMFHTMARTGERSLIDTTCAHLEEAVWRTVDEVGATYPAFDLRGLDWQQICQKHVKAVLEADDPFAAAQRWLAELQDAHTKVYRTPRVYVPYVLNRDRFIRVPEWSAAHAAGVRPGWHLTDLDMEDQITRTAASPHMRPLLAGWHLLGGQRELRAQGPNGATATWQENSPKEELINWRKLSGESGYLRLRDWSNPDKIRQGFDAALTELHKCERLIIDLRANPGGSLLAATETRDRFLRSRTRLGSARYTDGSGGLGPGVPVYGEPSSEERWAGRLVVLTDPLTYSASEDFLLGLQGLEHVRVIGRPSGGGSGRPRTIKLIDDWVLMCSTTLTYDREGRCVEGTGITVDTKIHADGPSCDLHDPAIREALA
ncbi:S41 family peptidase [Streptosporangium sp. NPDC000396]|uniref:S41 family peptidase n=1 Tax=Streptosporangium sp. NPDC000396 TaxID=3366185 RepID=UPI0036C0C7E4